MPENVRLLKGRVVVEGKLSGPEQELLVEKYKSKKAFEFWRTQLKSLAFLKELPSLESLSLVNARIEDVNALSEVNTLKTLFLNEARLGSDWGFLANLCQIEELHILNIRGELALPDLGNLDCLRAFRIWGCKGLADISALENTPRLEEVELIDTGLTPERTLPLFKKPSIKYLNASFGKKKSDELFQEYLERYGKLRARGNDLADHEIDPTQEPVRVI